ncbi:MAG: energy-coupling factor transporter transmembrane protein EcfT [Thermomicrobiales bacterium]|nr:energy-coupling factor transporter transmembrane protein EcfT [Thermomicrobiales bacterium]
MTASALEFYVPGTSWLHRMDPRVKLFVALLSGVVTFFWINLPLLVLALILVHVVLLASGYPWERLATAWRAISLLLVLIVLVWPLFDHTGDVILTLGPIDITDHGLLRGVANALRIAVINFLFVLWIGTTDARDLVRGFVRLGLPFRWGMALTIALRFIPTYAGTWATITDAQQARGLVLEGWWMRRARQMLPILVAALVSALRTSEQLAMTLESRGFGASRTRTVLRDIQMRSVDWLVLAVTVVLAALLIWQTLFNGFGQSLFALFA